MKVQRHVRAGFRSNREVRLIPFISSTVRRRWLAMLALLLAISGLFAWLARDRDPVFEGHRLSFWLSELLARGSESDEDGRAAALRVEDAKQAIRKMGPAAVPALLGRIEKHDSRVRAYVGEWLNKLPSSTFDPRPRQTERPLAAWAFEVLGPAGSNAVPRLMTLLGDRVVGEEAMRALAGIGEPAVPALRAQLSGSDPAEQERAIVLLGRIGPGAAEAARELMALATNASPVIARQALLALAFIGSDRPWTTTLASANLLATNSADYAAMTLAALGRDGLPFLLKGLTNAEPTINAAALTGLGASQYFTRGQSPDEFEWQHSLRRIIEHLHRSRSVNTRMVSQGSYRERRIATTLTNQYRVFPAPSRALAARLMAQLPGQGEIVRPALDALTSDLDPEVRAAAWDGLWQLGPAPPPAPVTNTPAALPAGRRGRRGPGP